LLLLLNSATLNADGNVMILLALQSAILFAHVLSAKWDVKKHLVQNVLFIAKDQFAQLDAQKINVNKIVAHNVKQYALLLNAIPHAQLLIQNVLQFVKNLIANTNA